MGRKFMPYYVFFYSGYVLAPLVFKLARHASARPAFAIAGLALWALFDGHAVVQGHAALPGVSLALGLLGAGAIVVGAALLSRTRAAHPFAYCGGNSIVIYLGFYIPLVVTARLALLSGWIGDTGMIAVLATAAGIAAPLALHRLVRGTRLAFLFERPARFWLARSRHPGRLPAVETA